MDTPPLLKRLLRVSKAHGLLHGIRAGSLNNDGHFPPYVEHVFGQSCRTRRDVLKRPISPKNT
jgi:hypothetical protein